MTTPVELINLALKQSGVLGVGQTATSEDVADAFKLMNMMLAQWQTDRFLVYRLVTTGKACTGQLSYTVGIGGDFNIPRPDRISSAFVQLTAQSAPNKVDYPLTLIQAREDYNRIAVKQQGAMPTALFYDSNYPLGSVFPWSVPDSQYTLFITTYVQLQQFTSPFDDIVLPPQYEDAILWNLAGRLCPMYGLEPSQTIIKLASAGMNTLKTSNTQVPSLTIDPILTSRGKYNVYSDIPN
jgi:hypothetical protein